jgi:hypothetical protein
MDELEQVKEKIPVQCTRSKKQAVDLRLCRTRWIRQKFIPRQVQPIYKRQLNGSLLVRGNEHFFICALNFRGDDQSTTRRKTIVPVIPTQNWRDNRENAVIQVKFCVVD